MNKQYAVKDIRFTKDRLMVTVDGVSKSFLLKKVSPALLKASVKERNTYEIAPSGYGISWPLIDEDLSINGLLGVTHKPKKKLKTA